MSGYTIRKVSELAAEYGEDFVNRVTKSFSCRFNDEVDNFLKRNSLDFARRKVSVTELVFDNESQLCAGYFTLAVKPIQIPASALSSTQRKRIERFSKLDPLTDSYTVAAYLIAQFGKNWMAMSSQGRNCLRSPSTISAALRMKSADKSCSLKWSMATASLSPSTAIADSTSLPSVTQPRTGSLSPTTSCFCSSSSNLQQSWKLK